MKRLYTDQYTSTMALDFLILQAEIAFVIEKLESEKGKCRNEWVSERIWMVGIWSKYAMNLRTRRHNDTLIHRVLNKLSLVIPIYMQIKPIPCIYISFVMSRKIIANVHYTFTIRSHHTKNWLQFDVFSSLERNIHTRYNQCKLFYCDLNTHWFSQISNISVMQHHIE